MKKTYDQSELDDKYFINNEIYNCPFCKRRHLHFTFKSELVFDWTNEKKCYLYQIRCDSCEKNSIHFSYIPLPFQRYGSFTPEQLLKRQLLAKELDTHIFLSIPSSSFTLDSNIPKILRDLFFEAEGCLKSNFLTGSSVCIRKIIYELAHKHHAEGADYSERIKSLKNIFSNIEPLYFDTLITIQELTSTKVHENSYDNWESKHLRVMLASIAEVLFQIYILPNNLIKRREELLSFKKTLLEESSQKTETIE